MQHGHKRHKKHKGRLEQQRLEAIEEQCSGSLCPRSMEAFYSNPIILLNGLIRLIKWLTINCQSRVWQIYS